MPRRGKDHVRPDHIHEIGGVNDHQAQAGQRRDLFIEVAPRGLVGCKEFALRSAMTNARNVGRPFNPAQGIKERDLVSERKAVFALERRGIAKVWIICYTVHRYYSFNGMVLSHWKVQINTG